MELNLEEGDLVLCTVDRIIGTNVFVKISHEGKEIEGTLTFSEISPGRIRNIRDYVVPKKKIVCKVLRISGNSIDLTYRRVTQEERKKIKEKVKLEKSYENILKGILGNRGNEIIDEISKKENLYDFLEKSKENPKELEKIAGKTDTKKIIEILNSQKSKKFILKRDISLTTNGENGLESIKNILGTIKDVEISYIASGRYSLKKESENPKKAEAELDETLKKLENSSKKEGIKMNLIKS